MFHSGGIKYLGWVDDRSRGSVHVRQGSQTPLDGFKC